MANFNAGVALMIFSLALCLASAAEGQVNLEEGKTAAQLFASDCTGCHKRPQTVNQANSMFGLEGFLRDHYTTSPQSAAALAAYLEAQAGSKSGRTVTGTSQAIGPGTKVDGFMEEDIPRPPADIPMPSVGVKPGR